MKILGKKNLEKQSHQLSIKVYEDFVEIAVVMGTADFVELIPYGFEYERLGLNRLVKAIFNSKYEGLKIFNNDNEYVVWYNSRFKDRVNNSNGVWSKTVIIELASDNFEDSLKSAMKYITLKSNEYEKSTPDGKATIAEEILKQF